MLPIDLACALPSNVHLHLCRAQSNQYTCRVANLWCDQCTDEIDQIDLVARV